MTAANARKPKFDDPELQLEIMKLRKTDNVSNLYYLAKEYFCLLVVIGTAIALMELRKSWGYSWHWSIPIAALAVILIGGLQHRLAGLGHESSHFTFMKNRYLNDLIPDLFCMFPLMTTVHFYRVFHMAHHQHTNDPERDPDLLNLGRGKRAFEFPMTRAKFIAVVYFCMFVAPIRFMEFQLAYVAVNALGKGKSIYNGTEKSGRFREIYLPRLGTILGVAYVLGLGLAFNLLVWNGASMGLIVGCGLAGFGLACLVIRSLPDWALFSSPFRQAYSIRTASYYRIGFYTFMLTLMASLRWMTGGASTIYPGLFWFLPLISTFPFFMLLRDVYQHSNADDGRLTNSRVFFVDPFTRWAVFVYGQDMHIPHHLFPAIPHYRLESLHEVLKAKNEDYEREVIECHGTFHDSHGRVTILDEMTRRPTEPQPSLAT